LHEACCFWPNRTGSFFFTFPSEQNAVGRSQAEIGRLQTNDFADPRAGVEHQAQQRQVSAAIAQLNVYRAQYGLDLLKIKMFDLAGTRALERNAQNALGLFQMLRILPT
jgi:hypothetical protein